MKKINEEKLESSLTIFQVEGNGKRSTSPPSERVGRRLVSIIIPVYNVEDYLEECLHSVVNQTFLNMEIILVNDGSTDRSPEIMKTFAAQDDRIKIITQSNSGVSAARNRGLRAASGEYILFIDSDDTILPDSVETLYHKARETESDLVLGNALWCYPEDERQELVFWRDEELNRQTGISGEMCYIKLMDTNAFPPLVYLFFMKRELIIRNKIFFKEGIIHEDELWCIKAMLSATRATMIDFNYYYYRQREGSLMNSNNSEFRINSLFTVAKEVKKMAQKSKKENKSTELTNCLYTKIFNLLHFITKLCRETDTNNQPFSGIRFFTNLLLKIYPELPYEKQRICLTNYYFINPIINNRMKGNFH